MKQSEQNRLVGKHEMNRKSLYEKLARAIYYEVQALVPYAKIAEWHGPTLREVEALTADYREILRK